MILTDKFVIMIVVLLYLTAGIEKPERLISVSGKL